MCFHWVDYTMHILFEVHVLIEEILYVYTYMYVRV